MTTMFDEYQSFYRELDSRFNIEGDPTLFACLGMGEEAGECLGKIKRVLRGEKFDHAAYVIELGDLLGYLTMAVNYQELSLSSLIERFPYFGDPKLNALDRQEAALQLFNVVSKTLDVANSGVSDKQAFVAYLRSILFWICQCAHSIDSTLEAVISANELKMRYRIKNDTLLGTGDNR